MAGQDQSRFSALLLEGLDHYRKGRMIEAVRAWEEAYLLEPSNLRAREFLRSALERIHAHTGDGKGGAKPAEPAAGHPWLPNEKPAQAAQPPAPQIPVLPPLAEPAHPGRPSFFEPPTESPKTPARSPAPPPPALRSPWDEGPSKAIEQPESAGEAGSGAWSIHDETTPVDAVTDDETEVWMRGARELLALNDFSGALELLNKVLARKANDRDALQMHEQCEDNLTLMYESKLGSMEARPAVAIPPDEVIWLNLDPRAGFVLAQIDGEVSFDDLYAICGLKRLDTARILCELLEQGVVSVEGEGRTVAKRAMHRS
jgi:tetratricopeptide (TPR) repeat protein